MVATLAVTLFGGCEEQVFEYDFINNAGEEPTPTPTPGVSANKVIYYTSTDGKMITEPAGITGLVSHTYKNGQGAITYNHDIKLIPDEAFKGYKTLKSIKLPSSVTSIGDKTFYNCVNLTSITIPSSVTSIGDNAFESCTSLTSAIIPKSVTSIGDYAFNNCTSLTSVTIPNGVTSIGNYAFNNCKSLTSVTIPESVTSIGNQAFYCSGLTSVTIPDSVTSIGNNAFDDCNSLKRVDITDLEAWCKVEFSNSYANPTDNEADLYLNGSKLTELTIPNGITAIKPYTFSRCTSITNVTIPGHVTEIGTRAFYYCNNLTSAIIGEGVTAIGDYAFYSCSKLAEVYCKPTTPPTLNGDKAFTNNASNRMIFVPSESVDKYKYAPYWNTHKSFIVADPSADPSIATNTIEYTSSDGKVVTPHKTDVFGVNIVSNVYENGKGVITFDGPVTTIGAHAFYECSTLASITIPNSVTSIGYYAFGYCTSLT
ncbi:MAG: leucine-rich repeat domain-containing protein, partial [Alistipes sp.]|nr:leucine-rich repeat domain-containing protein [Alistipes sp.]